MTPLSCSQYLSFGIHIYARHYPVTVTWNDSEFRTEFRTGSFIASHTTNHHIQYWTEVPQVMDYTHCMAEDSTYTVTGTDDPWEWYNRRPIVLTNDSSAETSVLQLQFVRKSTQEPYCPIIVSVEPPATGTTLRVFPNPAGSEVRIALREGGLISEELYVRIYNAGLQVIGTHPWPASSHYVDIPLHRVPAGVYVIEIRDRRGQMIGVEKLIVE